MNLKNWLPLIILFIFLNAAADSIMKVRGVNYDPVHSIEFAKAVGTDDQQGMIDAIHADLDKLAELQNNGFSKIRFLKTFFSSYLSLGVYHAPVVINIADVIDAWNKKHPANAIKLALGVYEFTIGSGCGNDSICKEWTQAQVNSAIQSANTHPDLIDRIIVGNEDVNVDNGQMRSRIVADIQTIKNQINNKSIQVGTAQTIGDGYTILTDPNYAIVKNTADFIGVNIYPYWSGDRFEDAQNIIANHWNHLNTIKQNKNVIVTEEGWPSQGNSISPFIFGFGTVTPGADSSKQAHDYFLYWYNRDEKVAPISYYFSLFDKSPGQGVESHWGIFSADRNSSLLGASEDKNDFTKPLSKEHALVSFYNLVNDGRKYSKVSVNVCLGDWNSDKQTQDTCYPIDGYNRTGDIPVKSSHQFMLDVSGKTYSSILVVFYDDQGNALRLCYIDRATLMQMTPQTQVFLKWVQPDGAVPCSVSFK